MTILRRRRTGRSSYRASWDRKAGHTSRLTLPAAPREAELLFSPPQQRSNDGMSAPSCFTAELRLRAVAFFLFFFLPCNCAQTQTRCTRHSRGANKGPNSLASQRQAELIPHYITQCQREGKTHRRRHVGEVLQVAADCPRPLPRCIGG